jgi:hypothetical protein
MSTLTGLISGGGGGSPIASMQRGNTTASQSATITNQSIGAVDLSKSFVLATYTAENTVYDPDEFLLRTSLTSSTNIEFYRHFAGGGSQDNLFIHWQVIEYA